MKIIFLGTSDFAIPALKILYKNNFDIPLVITKKDSISKRGNKLIPSEIKQIAIELNLKVETPSKNELLEIIKPYLPIDFLVCAAYGIIIPKEVLNLPKYGAINIHGSLLPKLRGSAPIQRAILNQKNIDDKTGVSLMLMDEGLDSGDILCQKETEISEKYFQELSDNLANIGAEMLLTFLKEIRSQKISEIMQEKSKKQNEEDVTYASPISKEEGLLNFNDFAEKNVLKVRALSENPGTYFTYNNQKIKINRARIIKKDLFDIKMENTKFGEIVKITKTDLLINSGGEIFAIEELTIPGKKKMNIVDYLRGNPIFKEHEIIS